MVTERYALVTGASRGIGAATAKRLAADGMIVVVNYPGEEERDNAEAVVSAIRDAGGTAMLAKADVSVPDAVAAMVEGTVEEFGGLDVVVNNAGIYPRTTWDSISWDEWSRTLSVNVGGVFNVTRFALPILLDRDGTIVNTSSIWGLRGGSADVGYTASKGAIVALTKQLCQEYATEGLRANAVAPGAIATPLNADARADDDYRTAIESAVPSKRFGEAEEVADLIAFLASPKASYVNGECIFVDGGLASGTGL
jgi:NAD(P)-dependent dehydrogenase (short-subunit alcohol dehydrogenase family)